MAFQLQFIRVYNDVLRQAVDRFYEVHLLAGQETSIAKSINNYFCRVITAYTIVLFDGLNVIAVTDLS